MDALPAVPAPIDLRLDVPLFMPHRPEVQQRLIRSTILLISILISATTSILHSIYPKDPQPYHTSALSGEEWVIELLTGHPERIRCELGVHAHVFGELISEMRTLGHTDSKFVSLEEQLAIFLYTVVTGLPIRHTGERFQRSNETISRYFRRMLIIFSSPPFYSKYVRLPDASIPRKIHENPKFWPFFKDTVGAIDGSHIHASPRAFERGPYRNRKGFVSQNCLFACDFEMNFTYALTGWEGSATDARIYEDARAHDLRIPPGKYFLADAGFPLRPELLVPYRGVRYHLAEWGRASVRPANKKELFNLRHASARNVIERIFGVLKRRFRILLLSPSYSMAVQAQIPAALCSIHNFIRFHDPTEGPIPVDADNEVGDLHAGNWEQPAVADDHELTDADVHTSRDHIAEQMWLDYQRVLQERSVLEGDSDDDLSDQALSEDEDGLGRF